MKRSEFWNRLFNSGGNGIFVFIGTALIAGIAIVITACPGVADAILGEPKYTVSYHVNGGEGTSVPASQKINDGGTATKPTDPTRTGYTFNGWFDAATGGNEFNFGSGGTPITADITLYAQWTKQHTVSYNVNQGEGTPDPTAQTVSDGETIAAAPTGISRPGYTLNDAWNTQADGTGNSFLFGDEGTAVTEDITLYAQWSNQQHTVSYHANGGDGTPNPATQEINHNDIIASAPTVSKNGYTLNTQWNTQADGNGESFSFGSGGTPVTEDMDLYAQWTINQYTVSYHINQGEGTANPATETVNHGETIAAAPTGISRPGHTLNTAWNTQADGNGDSFSFGSGGTPVTEDIELYAQWTIIQYTVSYHANEGEGTPNPATQKVDHNATIATAPTGISKPGHTLNAVWNTKADGTGHTFSFGSGGTPVTANMDLYAQWTINQYTVSYNFNRGDGTVPTTETVNYKGTAPKPSDPTRTGYTFAGWFDAASGGSVYNFGTEVTADMDLYAQWTINQYTVSYNFNRGDGTVPATETVNYKGTAPKPSDPTRTGYTFAGWFDAASGGSVYNFGTEVTADMDLYAQWTINQYTVSYNFNRGDGTVPATETVNYKGIAPKPSDPTRTGYTFAGWFDAASGGSVYNFGTEVTADIDLYAQWTINQYTVSYNFNRGDGTVPATETVNYKGTAPKPSDPTRTGYTFAGWFDAASGGSVYNFGTEVTADIDLYAQWTINQYTVSYNFNRGDGTVPATETVNYKGTAPKPSDPTRSGHAFTGWFDAASGGSVYNFGTEVTADMDLYAQWTIMTYTVSYNFNRGDGTEPSTETVDHGGIATEPTSDPTRTGYTFAGWFDAASGGSVYNFGTEVTADIDLYAQWTINQYTVSYNFNRGDGTAPAAETVNYNETAPKPSDPTRTGYTFAGWFDAASGGSVYNFGTEVTADIDLYAQWTINQYTVSYNFNRGDGTAPAAETVNYNETAPKPSDPTRTGYTFAGWFDAASGGSVYNFGTEVTADIDLYAQWTINQYMVSYNFNRGDGTAPATETVNYNETAPKPSDPTRTGYTFAGWFDAASGGSVYNFGTEVTADIDLYAQWTINQYTVSYNFNRGDGTVPATETVNYKGTAPKPSDPTRTGYTFAGWFDAASGGSVYNFGTEVTADMDLYAQWTINQYTVSYNFNRGDGTVPATETVNYKGTAPKPTNPTRSGHAFTGWFDATSGGSVYNFGTEVTADIDLYAQWTINQYTVSYHANQGEGTPNPETETVNYGERIATAPTGISRPGYTLNTAWNTNADGTGSSFLFGVGGTAVTEDITLYAQWTPTLTISGLSPANGSSTTDTTPTFNWNAVPGAAGYELRIAESQSGLENAATVRVTGPSYTPSAGLTIGQTYYWRVRAKDWAGQFGNWSAVHSIEVVAVLQGFVHVAGGTFQMGSTDSEAASDESPVHSVTVDSFYMAETELTFDQYDAYCTAEGISKPDDRGWGRGSRPAINVSWDDAVNYCNWLSGQDGLTPAYDINGTIVSWNQSANGYRLPTEAEWEYAARGGAQSNGYKYAGSNDVGEVGWYFGNSGGETQPVKGKKANELGLHDMSGNVWEWCWDWYGNYSSADQTNPTGPSSGSYRVVRGGSWLNNSRNLRSASRGINSPGYGYGNVNFGFRLVRPAD